MTNRIQVTSKEVEGVVFYGSRDGKISGISQSGLARLCGVSHQAVQGNKLFKTLKTVPVKDSSVQGDQLHSFVNLVEARDSMKMLRYFAYESKAANDTAKFFYHKFAEEGAHQFCLHQSGVTVTQDEPTALSGIVRLAEDYIKLYRETETNQTGLHQINQGIINQVPALDSEVKSLKDILDSWGIELSRGQLSKLGRKISEVYSTHREGNKPTEMVIRYTTKNGKLATSHVCGYKASDYILIKIALSSIGISI